MRPLHSICAFVVAAILLVSSSPLGAAPNDPSIVVFAQETIGPSKGRLMQELARERGMRLDYVYPEKVGSEQIAAALKGRALALFDWPNDAPLTSKASFKRLRTLVEPALRGFVGKVWGGLDGVAPNFSRGVTEEQSRRIMDYIHEGGRANEARLMDYLRVEVFGLAGPAAEPATKMAEVGIYHPDAGDRLFASLADYHAWRAPRPGQKVVALAFHRALLMNDTLLHIDDAIRRLEAKGAYPIAFWAPPGAYEKNEAILTREGAFTPDALLAFTYVFNADDTQARLAAAHDRPILQAMVYSKGYEDQWRESPEGLQMALGSYYYDLGELGGRIDATMVAALRRSDDQLAAMPEQMEALVERALGWTNLRHKPNHDKTIGLFIWNTPPGEENFQASYLNVPASLVELVKNLRADGYDIPPIEETQAIETIKRLIRPYYRTKDDAELRRLVADGLADRVPVTKYRAFLSTLPAETQKAMAEGWENPEDTYLSLRDGDHVDFIVPRWRLGNLTILPQPLRGARRSQEADILHDRTRPLHHAYRAVYFDIVHERKVDAIVHFGTHGTQEFLLGKERAPSVWDDTQTTIGNIPVIYPYAVNNPGEAITAKRRGRAVIVSHDDPPYAPSGLYGELAELHELINTAENATPGLMRDHLIEQIRAKSVKLNVAKDVAMTDEEIAADPRKLVEKIDGFLHNAANLPQPLGLRTFGVTAPAEKVLTTVLQILGPDYIKSVGETPSLILARPYQTLDKTASVTALRRAVIENEELSAFPEKARPFLAQARTHFAHFMAPMETQNVLKALSGGFVPTSTGNDPIRNPDAVPTGRNLHGFDPRRMPTKAAWEAGVKLGRELLEEYKRKHGAYPDKVAFELWQVEAIRHFGVIEAKILYLLGVEPVWNERGEVVGSRVLPKAELDHPRVDPVMSLGGIYRDNLAPLMTLLQEAVNKVAALEEDENPIARNADEVFSALLASGMERDRARRLSRVRLFSNESGVYGNKMAAAALASGMWNDEKPLAETYLERMGYAYGLDADLRNIKLDKVDLYAKALSGVKAAILSRSSNSYGVLNSDDPYQYLGGIALAVRHLDGKTPDLLLSDLRDPRRAQNKTLAEFMATELRAHMFHPRYIEELMKERYAGATRMVYNLDNFWGWNVMDRSSVRADQWQEFYEVYAKDKYALGLKAYFDQHHPAALAQMAERMLEAVRKGYWDAPEEVVKTLVELHRQIAAAHDLHVDNEKFAEFVQAKAQGYGLAASAPAKPAQESASAAQPTTQQVQGVKLEKQTQEASQPPDEKTKLLAILFGCFALGALWELGTALRLR